LKRYAVPGFRSDAYRTHRLDAPSRDGTLIPVSLLTSSEARPDGKHPLYVLGYGAYGLSSHPEFDPDLLSLVDRGFVVALAHVRGGQERGRAWYEAGRGPMKMNTFTDFIDVTEHLLGTGWGDPLRVAASGRSAGGLLMGAVANLRPDLFTAIVTSVPFVDVVTTMLDATIPLTTFERDEWGNPEDADDFATMLSYSPYDQVKAQQYPHMLVTTGLWDPAVAYWEPAKWVARLRERKTDEKKLLLWVDMEVGHQGKAGRYESLNDTAREYAFILDALQLET
jgi:oligopeptidase B